MFTGTSLLVFKQLIHNLANHSNITNLAQRNFTMFRFHAVFHIGLQIDKANIIERYIHYENYKH